MSWKVGATDRDADPVAFNALRFATKDEAEAYAADLFGRWLSCKRTELHESSDPVNARMAERFIRASNGEVCKILKLEHLRPEPVFKDVLLQYAIDKGEYLGKGCME